MNSTSLIYFNSKYYHSTFFKKTEKPGLLLKLTKDYLYFTPSIYDDMLTRRANATMRFILHRRFIKNLLYQIHLDDIINIIISFVGYDIHDVYLDNKKYDFLSLFTNLDLKKYRR